MQHINDQHTTPKCYLKNFSEDGKLIYRKFKRVDNDTLHNKELKKPISLKSVTTKDNFYTVKSGNEPMLVESILYSREIENYYPKYYKLFTDPKGEILPSMEDRSRALMCFLSLHCRTPKQFKYFFQTVPEEYQFEIDEIKEDYKVVHARDILPSFIKAHEFKIFKIATLSDSSEFFTSDNPVLILGQNGELLNHKFREQFNIGNRIVIPLDPKNCCILTSATDKHGASIEGKLFYNRIQRVQVDHSFAQEINHRMLDSADEYIFGTQKYLKTFFSLYRFVE